MTLSELLPLAHEVCHVRRRGTLTAGIPMLVEAVFWFHPLVWWIRERLIDQCERACDAPVLQSCNAAEAYAEGILKICKFCVESLLACVSRLSGSDLEKRVVCIVSQGVAYKLGFERKLLLIGTVAAMALPLAFGFVNAPQLSQRRQVEDGNSKLPEFEVATIRVNKSGDRGGRFAFTTDGFTAEDVPLVMLLKLAYGVEEDEIVGLPTWIKSQQYDIAAKVDGSEIARLNNLSIDQRKRMIGPLLVDRFDLQFHRGTKSLSVYALVIAKGGPRFQESKPEGPGFPIQGNRALRMMGRGYIVGQGVPMELMRQALSDQLGQTVVDKTGLIGSYDFTLKWTPDEVQMAIFNKGYVGGNPNIDNASPPNPSGPSIFTALQEQLGLKLKSDRSQIEVMVIDRIEKPSEN